MAMTYKVCSTCKKTLETPKFDFGSFVCKDCKDKVKVKDMELKDGTKRIHKV